MSDKVVTFTAETFDAVALAAGTTAVVDFWASWCAPCRALAPTIAALAEEQPDVVVGKLNVDEHPEVAERYGITSIPCVLVFRDGQVAAKSVGLVPIARLRELLVKPAVEVTA